MNAIQKMLVVLAVVAVFACIALTVMMSAL